MKHKSDGLARVPQRDKLKMDLSIRTRDDLTEKQKEFIELALDKKIQILFVSGPAGTSKTFLSVFTSLMLINEKRLSDIIYVRSIVESSDHKLGFLPGESSAKFAPYLQPLIDKLDELLPKGQVDNLVKEERVQGLPIGFLRGLDWNAKAIILDEAQNATFKELVTTITRLGKFSKMYIVGDPEQSDINGKSGFTKMFNIFNTDTAKLHGIYTFKFTKEDIVRNGLIKFILEEIEKFK